MAEGSLDVRAELTRAGALVKAHKLDEAEVIFTGLMRSPVSSADGMYGLGVIAFLRKDLEAAGDWMNHSLALRPDNANAVYYLGVIAERRDPSVDSSQLYEQALKIDPRHHGARTRLSQLRGPTVNAVNTDDTGGRTQNRDPVLSMGTPPAALPRVNGSTGALKPEPAHESSPTSLPPSFYQALSQDKSALGLQTRRLIDAIQSVGVRPALSAYLGPLLGISLLWLIVFVAFAMSPLGQRTVFESALPAIGGDTLAVSVDADAIGSANPLLRSVTNASALFLVATLAFLTIGYVIARIKTTRMSFDHGRVAIVHGVFHRSSETHELLRVHDVAIQRTLLNRFTGDGSLILELTAGQAKHAESIKLRGYAKTQRLQELMIQVRDLVLLLRSGPWGKGVIY